MKSHTEKHRIKDTMAFILWAKTRDISPQIGCKCKSCFYSLKKPTITLRKVVFYIATLLEDVNLNFGKA
jgi:hypothetical protein